MGIPAFQLGVDLAEECRREPEQRVDEQRQAQNPTDAWPGVGQQWIILSASMRGVGSVVAA
jgi:hypothetical protein